MTIGLLPGSDPDVSGCLFIKDGERPSASGLLIYLNAEGASTRRSPPSSPTAVRSSSPGTRSARTASGPSSLIAKAPRGFAFALKRPVGQLCKLRFDPSRQKITA